MEPDHTAPTTGRKAQWNPTEVSAFVNYLHEHRAEQGDARNFKLFVYALLQLPLAPIACLDLQKLV